MRAPVHYGALRVTCEFETEVEKTGNRVAENFA